MPELPEVETVRRTIEPNITGRKVETLLVLWEGALVGMDAGGLRARLVGARFTGAFRRGKYLGLQVETGAFLVVHLRMTGRLVVRDPEAPRAQHLRWLITLDDGHELHFIDQRKFGKVYWADDAQEFETIAHVGPEPLSDQFTASTLATALSGSKVKVKSRLLDQARLAGLGNIYVDESLFRANIHPEREAGSLSESEVDRLWLGIRTSLTAGLEHGGTTFRDYVDGMGNKGENQNYLLVYGKAGAPCPSCGTALLKTKVGGRGTVFCPACQK